MNHLPLGWCLWARRYRRLSHHFSTTPDHLCRHQHWNTRCRSRSWVRKGMNNFPLGWYLSTASHLTGQSKSPRLGHWRGVRSRGGESLRGTGRWVTMCRLFRHSRWGWGWLRCLRLWVGKVESGIGYRSPQPLRYIHIRWCWHEVWRRFAIVATVGCSFLCCCYLVLLSLSTDCLGYRERWCVGIRCLYVELGLWWFALWH